MHKTVPLLVLVALLAGCGGSKEQSKATPTATATPADALAGYSAGVRKYYTGANLKAADDPNGDPEEKYFQPPKPAEAGLGGTIRLTGANIGVQIDATVDDVKTVERDGKRYTAVGLQLKDSGIAQLNSALQSADLTYGDGTRVKIAEGANAPCSNGFPEQIRVDVGTTESGCLLFPPGDAPQRLRLALETVPTDAGGIWNLR